jgi:protein-disulfide isomerase
VARRSGVASAQIVAAGGGMGGINVGEPVRLGAEVGDPSTVWRVAVRPDDPMIGPAQAPVTVVVFEDFECPFCAKLQPVLTALAQANKDKLRIVFKHNPLPFHKNAMPAAEAAEAARSQGKFWQMHDRLYGAQDKLDAESIRGHAQAVGLDLSQFDNALKAGSARERIQADVEQAAALSARGTPNIFINGKKLVGAKEQAVLQQVVDAELARALALAKGGAPDGLYERLVGEGKLLDSLGAKAEEVDTTGAAFRGPAAAAINIVTFQDFQCPFCARLDPHIAEMEKEFPGQVRVTWLDFPLRDIHPNADLAAQAGKEALAQGKLWRFHEAVMADQSKLDREGLLALGKKAGLNTKALAAALDSGKWKEAVQRERATGEKLGVKGTPSVFINGHAFVPQLGFSANTFRTAIRRLLGTRQ